MKTVSEISKQTGVSVRTLHYYDAIGLLPPASVTEAGYRLYDDAALGRLQHFSAADPAVQEKINALQNIITQDFYTCTKEILQGLGQMYTGDERFRRQIDRAGGAGTAEFVKQAIDIYCARA